MKNSSKIFAFICIGIIYSFAISTAAGIQVQGERYSYNGKSKNQHFSDASSKLFCITTENVSSINSFVEPFSPNGKNQKYTLTSSLKSFEQLLKTKILQYNKILNYFPNQFWKTAITFPFHYFW